MLLRKITDQSTFMCLASLQVRIACSGKAIFVDPVRMEKLNKIKQAMRQEGHVGMTSTLL